MRILFVDDEPLLLRAIARELSHEGYDLSFADSTETALSIVRSQPIDVVVCDLSIAPPDGLELCRMLATEHPQCSRAIMTALAGRRVHEARESGLIGWLIEKPWPVGALAFMLRTIAAART